MLSLLLECITYQIKQKKHDLQFEECLMLLQRGNDPYLAPQEVLQYVLYLYKKDILYIPYISISSRAVALAVKPSLFLNLQDIRSTKRSFWI